MTLDRGTQGLGMHLEDNGEPSPLNRAIVTGMAAGKPAKESGKIEAQDVLVGIDGRDVRGAPFVDVLELLKGTGRSAAVDLVFLRRKATGAGEPGTRTGARATARRRR